MSPEEIEAGRRLLSSPNDILALEYAMNTERLIPAAVRRIGAGYNDGPDDSHEIQSASGIRAMIREGQDIVRFVPDCTGYAASAAHVMNSERWYDILRYAILSSTSEEIDECPSGGEGLGNLLKSAVKTAEDFEQLITAVKSRRYTYTRISRLCMQAMLGIRRGGFGSGDPGYIRVLGFTDKGREILSEMREDCPLPVITNLSKIGKGADGIGEDAMRMLELDIHAADIYNLMNDMDISAGSDYRKKPIIV
jgi:predicted nucleotidyltransferase